jgi:hypothetical protein
MALLVTQFANLSQVFLLVKTSSKPVEGSSDTLAVHGGPCYNFLALFKSKCGQQRLRPQNPNRLIHSK